MMRRNALRLQHLQHFLNSKLVRSLFVNQDFLQLIFEDRHCALWPGPHRLFQVPLENEGEGKEVSSCPPFSNFVERWVNAAKMACVQGSSLNIRLEIKVLP